MVELDGDIHDYQVKDDLERTRCLETQGYEVIQLNFDLLPVLDQAMQHFLIFNKAKIDDGPVYTPNCLMRCVLE